MTYTFRTVLGLAALSSLFLACGDDGTTSTSTGGGTTTSTGGNGQGGATSAGGASTGGSATGGASTGGGATGGAGQGGGAVGAPECTQDSDCTLSSNCCECAGRPNGETPPSCAQQCLVDQCQSLGLLPTATAECRAGRCVAPISCDTSTVVCDGPQPNCPAGQAPVVTANCPTGSCLPVLECDAVADCAACTGATQKPACVVDAAQLSSTHCVDVPSECSSVDCDCVGPSVCVGSFSICNESAEGLTCDCPTCLSP